jgi:rSAM/selenodomain-associated transferase 1
MSTIAVAIVCKTPVAGASKTRLSPPLRPEECAEISACFIADLAKTIAALAQEADVSAYALYTPEGSEGALKRLLPEGFELILQGSGDLGDRLLKGIEDLLENGHAGVILVNSDSPTIPKSILRNAVDAVKRGGNVTLGRAIDGGYTLIGLSRAHSRLFEEIPWSTEHVYRLTLERAHEIGLPIQDVPPWYDIDDAESYRLLEEELAGKKLPFMEAGMTGEPASSTRRFVEKRRASI